MPIIYARVLCDSDDSTWYTFRSQYGFPFISVILFNLYYLMSDHITCTKFYKLSECYSLFHIFKAR